MEAIGGDALTMVTVERIFRKYTANHASLDNGMRASNLIFTVPVKFVTSLRLASDGCPELTIDTHDGVPRSVRSKPVVASNLK